MTDTVNHVGDNRAHVGWSDKAGSWSWRHSVDYSHRKSSEDFLSDDDFESRDFSRNFFYDGKAKYQISPENALTIGGSYSQNSTGDSETFTYWPKRDNRFELAELLARLDHAFDDNTNGYLQ